MHPAQRHGDGACASTGVDHDFGPKNNLTGGTGSNESNVIGRVVLQGIEISHGWDPNRHRPEPSGRTTATASSATGSASAATAAMTPTSVPVRATRQRDNGNGVNVYDGSNFNLIEGNWVASVYDGIQTMSPERHRQHHSQQRHRRVAARTSRAADPGRHRRRHHTKSHVIEGNIIRNAGRYGIGLTQQDVLWVTFSRNIITDMSGPAIFLAAEPEAIRATGANNLQPAPVITSATTICGQRHGHAGATVEVYRASRASRPERPADRLPGLAVVAANGTWSMPVDTGGRRRGHGLQIIHERTTHRHWAPT